MKTATCENLHNRPTRRRFSNLSDYKRGKPVTHNHYKVSLPPQLAQPDKPVLFLIAEDLVNKLCRCGSIYLEKVDDVRDEMISNIGLGDFGSRHLLIMQDRNLVILGDCPLSRATERQLRDSYTVFQNY